MVTSSSGLLPRAMSGCVSLLLQPPSVLMSITVVIIKGSEAKSTRVDPAPHWLQYFREQVLHPVGWGVSELALKV